MTSDEAKELFSAAYDDELDATERAVFDAALAADPALAQQYALFTATVGATAVAAFGSEPGDAEARPSTPDLLPGVQQRLRARSRGRFYSDRFAERTGRGVFSPLTLALLMAALCAVAWLAFHYVQGIELRP
jgi:anti-sigma factor RsiW